MDIFFKNNTNENIEVNRKKEFDENCPLEWDIIVADQFNTYVPEIYESVVPMPLTSTDLHLNPFFEI